MKLSEFLSLIPTSSYIIIYRKHKRDGMNDEEWEGNLRDLSYLDGDRIRHLPICWIQSAGENKFMVCVGNSYDVF